MKTVLIISVLLFVIIIPSASALTFDNPRILFEGNSVQQVDVNTQIQFQARLSNNDGVEQPYVFFRTINDNTGNLIVEDWSSSGLEIGETIYLEMSWIPQNTGSYQIVLEIFDNIEKSKSLTDPLFLTLEVEGEPIFTPLQESQLEVEGLKLQIQTLEAQILDLQNQIDMLNQIVMEQVTVIYNWIMER